MKKLFIVLLLLILTSCSPDPVVEDEGYKLTVRGNGGAPIVKVYMLDCGDPLPPVIDIPTRPGYSIYLIVDTPYLTGVTHAYYDWNGNIGEAGRVYDTCEDLTLYTLWELN